VSERLDSVRDPYAQPLDASAGAGSGVERGVVVPRARSPFLLVEDVAARYRCSTRSIHELTRTGAIPHRRLPGTRRCLFLASDLEAYEAGCELEVVEFGRGGRVVRPKGGARS